MKRKELIFKTFLSDLPKGQKPRNRILLGASIILAVTLLYLALRGLDWSAFFVSLKSANYVYIVFLVLWSSGSYFLRAMRWRVLLTSQGNIRPINVFWANMAGYLGNNILPARAGELIRAAYIARTENIPTVFALATGITERLVDLAALVIIAATSLFFVDVFPDSIQGAIRSFAVVAVIGVAFIFLLPFFHNFARQVVLSLPLLGQSGKTKLLEMMSHFIDGAKVIAQRGRGLLFLFFTLLIWFMDGAGTMIFAFALQETLTLAQAFVFISALGLSSAIPSTPGYVGVYQFVAVAVLVPFGFARETALALILLSQVFTLLTVSIWGGLGLWIGSRMMLATSKNPDGNGHA